MPAPDSSDAISTPELSLSRLAIEFIRARRSVALLAILLGVLGALTGFLRPPTYSSQLAFAPAMPSVGRGSLTALAGQLGMAIPGQEAGQSAQFYKDLIGSESFLSQFLSDSVDVEIRSWGKVRRERLSITEILEIDLQADSAAGVREALEKLESALSVKAARETNVLRLTATTAWPEVSEHLASGVLARVEAFNADTRRTRSGAERRFMESRAEEGERDLANAERELERFLASNRSLSDSPELIFERERLQRKVNLQQQRYAAILTALEDSRVSEVRDTPTLTIVEAPTLPRFANSRNFLVRGLAGAFLGVFIALLFAAARATQYGRSRETEELREELATALGPIGRIFRRGMPSRST